MRSAESDCTTFLQGQKPSLQNDSNPSSEPLNDEQSGTTAVPDLKTVTADDCKFQFLPGILLGI